MIQQYRSLSGQNIYDVCLMTYGSLDLLFTLMKDNSFPGVNQVPAVGTVFTWDDTLVLDQRVYISNKTTGVNYATAQLQYTQPVVTEGFTYTLPLILS